MSYQPLANKYRPATFEELIGQDGVAKALANAIRLGREPRAVIFSGVRGIGKTTTARLYAKALNCEHGPTATPCGTCESCLAIVDGRHEDVLEIDGASNTGVDDVRSLRETISYVPQRSRFKVYIIDEVHMLSQSAFNALLKTLEEPPRHVVFVFATTELQRIPQTIISRCQTFYLQRFAPKTVVKRLKTVLEREGINYEEKALALVAKEGHGSMRDALTFLDQAIALGNGSVTMDGMSALIANVAASSFISMLASLIEKDAAQLLNQMQRFDDEGREFRVIAEELAKLCRHAFVIKDVGSQALEIELLDLDAEEISDIADLARDAAPFDLNRIFRTLVKCREDMDGSALDRYIMENYMLEWCFDPGLPSVDQLQSTAVQGGRLSPSRPLEQGPTTSSRTARAGGKGLLEQIKIDRPTESHSAPVNALAAPPAAEPSISFKPRWPTSWRSLVDEWKKAKPIQARIVEEAYLVEYSPATIHIAVPEGSLAADKLLDSQTQKGMSKVFAELFGFSGNLVVSRKQIDQNVGAEGEQQESLLDIKNREQSEKRAATMQKAKENPITKSVMAAFDAEIENVVVK